MGWIGIGGLGVSGKSSIFKCNGSWQQEPDTILGSNRNNAKHFRKEELKGQASREHRKKHSDITGHWWLYGMRKLLSEWNTNMCYYTGVLFICYLFTPDARETVVPHSIQGYIDCCYRGWDFGDLLVFIKEEMMDECFVWSQLTMSLNARAPLPHYVSWHHSLCFSCLVLFILFLWQIGMYIIVWRYLYSILGHKFWNSETTWSCLELYFASTSALILPVLCCDCRTNENPMIFGISQLICIAWQPGCTFLPAVEKKKLATRVNLTRFRDHSWGTRHCGELIALTQTVAVVCERLRTVANIDTTFREHTLTPRPPNETGTLATHSGKMHSTWLEGLRNCALQIF